MGRVIKIQCIQILTLLASWVPFSYGVTTIETFGDSLTAGALAKTSVMGLTPGTVSKILSDLSMYSLTSDLKYIKPYGSFEDAWPAYLRYLLATQGETVQVNNFASIGEKTFGLESQVNSVLYSGDKEISAFFFIGHNDLCTELNKSPEVIAKQFVRYYRRALTRWDKTHFGSKAYILPVGNVDQVFQRLKGYVWYENSNGQKFSCDDSWRVYFPYCRCFHELMKQGKLNEVVSSRIEAMNSVLETLVKEWAKLSNRNEYVFLKSLLNVDYIPQYFAADCFHMSRMGQKQMANAIFETLDD